MLIRTADHDLYPWYPDLLFFDVYGPTDKYEEIVRRVRERTSAEILLWTSHLSANEKPDELLSKLDERSVKILEVADKYHTLKINLRKKWCDYLIANNMAVTNLLKDSVHLKPAGCDVCADFISEELVRVPGASGDPATSGTITTIPVDAPAVAKGADGSMTLSFTGNRVVAVSDGRGWNTNRFVSISQRAIIEPEDWRVAWTLGYRKATLPEGFQVKWRSYPMFTHSYEPKPAGTRTLLVQGCANQAHTLTIIPEGDSPGIGAFIVHAPPAAR